MIRKLLTYAVLSGAILISSCSGQKQQAATLEQGIEEHYVKRVIDGDTLVLDDERHVRLLGINTPELRKKGRQGAEEYAVEASDRLSRLVGGNKKIKLEYDLTDKNKEDKDRFGRTLGYIIADGENTSIILTREGFARAFMYKDLKYRKEILEAEEEAKSAGRRIWARE